MVFCVMLVVLVLFDLGRSDSDDCDQALQSAIMDYGDSNQYANAGDVDYRYGNSSDRDYSIQNSGEGTVAGSNAAFDPEKFFESWEKSLNDNKTRENQTQDISGNQNMYSAGAVASDLQVSESESDGEFEDV